MTENPEQGARLERLIDALNLTQTSIAQVLGISQSYVSQMAGGSRNISRRVLHFITNNYPQVDVRWLLTGDGEMFLQKDSVAASGSQDPQVMEVDVQYEAMRGGIFESLLEREEKRRRPFTAEERRIVLAEIYQQDYWLFMLVMLHFLCLVRRTECYRMRFSDFHLAEGFILLPRTKTKNKKQRVVTIPDALRDFLLDERFARNPANYLLFGKAGLPHPSINAGDSTFKERHRLLLLRLKKAGKIADTTGLSLYSWKDTGMTEFAHILRPVELRDHAGHASIDQSLAYYHAEKVQPAVKRANITIET